MALDEFDKRQRAKRWHFGRNFIDDHFPVRPHAVTANCLRRRMNECLTHCHRFSQYSDTDAVHNAISIAPIYPHRLLLLLFVIIRQFDASCVVHGESIERSIRSCYNFADGNVCAWVHNDPNDKQF